MGHLVAAAFVSLALLCTGTSGVPSLGKQTAWQQKLTQRIFEESVARSSAASLKLAERLVGLRDELLSCGVDPAIASLPGDELAERIRREVAVSEVVSGFSERSANVDMSVDDGRSGIGYFENIWEAGELHNYSWGSDWWPTMDTIESELYGMRPFSNVGKPASLEEATERGPYCIVNLLRVDAGSPLYGNVSAVFATNLARDSSVVSPTDTGSWPGFCNVSDPYKPPGFEVNCSGRASPGTSALGTLRHFDHLFLQSDEYWVGGTLARFACRLLAPWGKSPFHGKDMVHYWEALPAAQLAFPKGVKFLIGSFPGLFGRDAGANLRQWCKDMGWVLVWSLGLNVQWDEAPQYWNVVNLHEDVFSNQRMGDPEVLVNSSAGANISVSSAQIAVFQQMWSKAATLRQQAAAKGSIVSNLTWAAEWLQLSADLAPFRLEPLRADSCSDVEACVGTTSDGHCVCYQARSESREQAQLPAVQMLKPWPASVRPSFWEHMPWRPRQVATRIIV